MANKGDAPATITGVQIGDRVVPIEQLVGLIGSLQIEIAILRGDNQGLAAALDAERAKNAKPTPEQAAAGTVRRGKKK